MDTSSSSSSSSSSISSSSSSLIDHFLPSKNPLTFHLYARLWLYRAKQMLYKLSSSDSKFCQSPPKVDIEAVTLFNNLREMIISKIRLSPHGVAVHLWNIIMKATDIETDKKSTGQNRCIFSGMPKLLHTVYLYVPTRRGSNGSENDNDNRNWYIRNQSRWKKYTGNISYSQLNPTIPLLYKRYIFVMHKQYLGIIRAILYINTLLITIDALIKQDGIEQKEQNIIKYIKQQYDKFDCQYQMIVMILKYPIIGH